jgi:hypothetical protein
MRRATEPFRKDGSIACARPLAARVCRPAPGQEGDAVAGIGHELPALCQQWQQQGANYFVVRFLEQGARACGEVLARQRLQNSRRHGRKRLFTVGCPFQHGHRSFRSTRRVQMNQHRRIRFQAGRCDGKSQTGVKPDGRPRLLDGEAQTSRHFRGFDRRLQLAQGLKELSGMTVWSPALRWYLLRALLLLATLLAPGCGYATYNIPLAELQRLSQLPPSQRGNHVRVATPGLVPVATSLEVIAAPVASPPAPPAVPPPPPEATAESEPIDPSIPPDMVDLSFTQSDPLSPPAFVSVNIEPPMPMVSVRSAPLARVQPPAPPLHVRPAPARMPPLAVGHPSAHGPLLGHIPAPRALPVRGSAPAIHAIGGHPHLGGGSHHSGGGGGGAAVGALIGAVVLVGLIVAIAEASQPTPFDGWIRTSPGQTLQLAYPSGSTREVRLCDLKLADTVGVRFAQLYDTNGTVERLESAATAPHPAQPPRPASPPASVPTSRPAVTPPQRPLAPQFTSSSDPFS